jgi:hypothetical protein
MGMARSQALCKDVDQRVRDALEAGRVAGRIILLNDCASRSLSVRFKRFSETLHFAVGRCVSFSQRRIGFAPPLIEPASPFVSCSKRLSSAFFFSAP